MILIMLGKHKYQTFADFEDEKCRKFCQKLVKAGRGDQELVMGNIKIRRVGNLETLNTFNLDATRNIIITGNKCIQFYDSRCKAQEYFNSLSDEQLINTYLIQGEGANGFEVWQYDIPVGTEVRCYSNVEVTQSGKIIARIFEPEIGIKYVCMKEDGELFEGYDVNFELVNKIK